MKELTIIAKNDVGALAAVAESLGSVGVNIEAISAYGQNNNAIFRVVTRDVESAKRTLSKVPNIEVREADTILYKMINRPGELGKITRKLSTRGIDLESLYIVSRKDDFTEVALKPVERDLEKAKRILEG